jgi:hypothetical protein
MEPLCLCKTACVGVFDGCLERARLGGMCLKQCAPKAAVPGVLSALIEPSDEEVAPG